MIETLEELGISPFIDGEKKLGRLIVEIKDDFIGKAVKYDGTLYILLACSRNYAYLIPKDKRDEVASHEFGDMNRAQRLHEHGFVKRVPRGHCWVPRNKTKSKEDLIQEIKNTLPRLNWNHYATQSKDEGTFVEGREEDGTLKVCIEL